MGLEISRERFDDADYAVFARKLEASVGTLDALLCRPGFGVGPPSLGAELELNLVDESGRCAPVNRAVLAEALDGRVTLEVDRFNLEINARPTLLAGRPLSALYAELDGALEATRRAASAHGARVVTIGILPTLTSRDLESSMLTDSLRYRALSAGIRRLRGGPFKLQIAGEDELALLADDVTFEGANTSFQIHLRVSPERFADTYNAAQLATAPALAVAGNSPLFLGKRLWDETRIALFRQSVDDRGELSDSDFRPARVSFGHGWVRRGAAELFAESVALHEPLLPALGPEDPEAACRAGGVPELAELRLHHGTVWRWNRAVYDPTGAGHLRIELRALPAGPTLRDMIANLAYLVGLTLGLAPRAEALMRRMTFGQARRNFYEAARLGLDAPLLWPAPRGPSPRPAPVTALTEALLPVAREGLASAGVDDQEATSWLSIIRERVQLGRTGARWQRQAYDSAHRLAPASAAQRLLERYIELSSTDTPVHQWP
jgi:gamma-glutamyl:cysteine ligase YbdK (ATP-grasp superfamily)